MNHVHLILLSASVSVGFGCIPELPEMGDTASMSDGPRLGPVSIEPHILTTDVTAEASVEFSDGDGSGISLAYEWYVNSEQVEATESTLEGEIYFEKDDRVRLGVTPSDSRGTGPTKYSEAATVSNSRPSTPGVNLAMVDRCGSMIVNDVDDEVSAASSDSLNLLKDNSDSMTVEAWIRLDEPSEDEGTIPQFLFGQFLSDSFGYQLSIGAGGTVVLNLPGGVSEGTSSDHPLQPEQWHHVMLSYNGENWYILIDGSEVLSHRRTTSLNTVGLPFWIGADPGESAYNFQGSIHAIRISDVSRHQADFSLTGAPLLPDSDTQALWVFGPELSEKVLDLSGNENTLQAADARWAHDCPFDTDYKELVCSIVNESVDPDVLDSMVYAFIWSVDGVQSDDSTVLDSTHSGISTEFLPGTSSWTCRAQASDGTDSNDSSAGEGQDTDTLSVSAKDD